MERILIVGGGIVGSCIAYHLARAGAAAAVTVVEPDPTYEFAATPHAVGAIRMQHALREDVEMSLYGAQVYSTFAEHVQGGKVAFDPQFRRCGYLYQVNGAEGIAALEADARMQREAGLEVQVLGADELRRRTAPTISVLPVCRGGLRCTVARGRGNRWQAHGRTRNVRPRPL